MFDHAERPVTVNHIAIVGFAETCQPPEHVWQDPKIEKWTLNHGHVLHEKWDRLFELHSPEVIAAESIVHHRGVDQMTVLGAERTREIYMRQAHSNIPRSVPFPIDEFVQFFGVRCDKLMRRPYAEMAAAYMLGYAIMQLSGREGARISVYGFELFDGEEYAHQRSCFEFYAGWAQGAGISMAVPETSAIFANRGLYEYENGDSSRLLNQANELLGQRFDEIKGLFAKASAEQADAVARMQTLSGIMQEVERMRKIVQHVLRGGSYTGSL